MAILVLAEHDGAQVRAATAVAVAAAAELGADIHVLVAGAGCAPAVEAAARLSGVTRVLHAEDEALADGLAEALAPTIARLAPGYSHVLAPATTFGKNVLPRAAALADVQMISDIVAVEAADTFRRPIYAGNALATVQTDEPVKMLTVRTTAFQPAPGDAGPAPVEPLPVAAAAGGAVVEGRELTASARPDLTTAGVVVSGGRGLGSKESFALLDALADRLGAAVGASRAAVDAGYAPNDYQVGQTGKVVAPDLYIAVGISGAIQHLAGMKDSKVIVAINRDEEAPIFQVADYGLVADLFDAVPALETELDRIKAPA